MSGHIDPSPEQMGAMMDLPDDGPIWMLNMIRLRKKAKYKDGREASGAEAFAAYARESEAFFKGVGARIVWSGKPQCIVIGPEDEHWDACFIAEYPSAAAFDDLMKNSGYQAVVFHRQAGVKDSRLIRLKPGEAGRVFG